MDTRSLKIITGPACAPSLVTSVFSSINREADRQGITPVPYKCIHFKDGETLMQIEENVRGSNLFIIQPAPMPDRNLVVLKQLLMAASLGSVDSLTAVIPYLAYLRQDRKDRPRVPITAKMVIQELTLAMDASARKHLMLLHPHSPSLSGFTNVPVDVLYPSDILAAAITKVHGPSIITGTVVSPDAGAAKLAEIYMHLLGMSRIAFGFKQRSTDDQPKIVEIAGSVEGVPAVVVDDMMDTGGTICGVIERLHDRGATDIYACVTHGIFADRCLENLVALQARTNLRKVFVTNSINNEDRKLPDFIHVVDIGERIAQAIWRNFIGGSISEIAGAFANNKKS